MTLPGEAALLRADSWWRGGPAPPLSHTVGIVWGGHGGKTWNAELDRNFTHIAWKHWTCWMDWMRFCPFVRLPAFLVDLCVYDQLTWVWSLPQRISNYALPLPNTLICCLVIETSSARQLTDQTHQNDLIECLLLCMQPIWVSSPAIPILVTSSVHLDKFSLLTFNLYCKSETAIGKRKYYAPLSLPHTRQRTSNLIGGGEALITVPTPLKNPRPLSPDPVFNPRRCRELQGCSPPWSMALSSAATPTSCAYRGRAGCPRARRRSQCAGNAITRRAGSLLETDEELSGSRSHPATVDGTGPLHREWTSTSEDTTAR